jgi:hypothetical protein
VTLEDGADCLLDFDDAVLMLDQVRGALVVLSVSISPAAQEARTEVAKFEGMLENLVWGRFCADEIELRLQLDPAHKTPHGRVILNRATFQRAEAEDLDDEPTYLRIWQRGVKLEFTLFRPSTWDGADASQSAPEGAVNERLGDTGQTGDDDIPF